MFQYIFYFFLYCSEAVIAIIYFSENFEQKKNTYTTYFASIGFYIIGFAVNLIDNNIVIINLTVFLLINILMSKCLYNISFKESLLHSSILLAIMFGSEMLVESIIGYILRVDLYIYRDNISILIIFGVVSKIVYLFICKIISYFFSYKNIHRGSIKQVGVLSVFPIFNTFVLALFLYTSANYKLSTALNIVFVTISVLSLILTCYIFIAFRNMQLKENEIFQLQSEKQKHEINKTFYALLEEKNNNQRVLIHDTKHHYAALMSMKSIDDVREYISKIQPKIDDYCYIGKTNNKTFDLILSKYSMLCSKNDVDFEVDIRASNLSFIEDSDLVSLLGNLLDNSFEASKGCENAFIRISTTRERDFIVLNISNSCSIIPVSKNNRLLTTKTDTTIHGYGTKSIEKTADKYNGICQWDYNKELNEFQYTILFNKTIK